VDEHLKSRNCRDLMAFLFFYLDRVFHLTSVLHYYVVVELLCFTSFIAGGLRLLCLDFF